MQLSWKNPLKALPVLLLLATYAGVAFGAAGNVQFVIGDVKLITRAGQTRALQKGAEINEGDRIVTAAGASAQIKMVDGGFIAVRPSTDMGFDTYRYSGKEDGTENAVVSLLQGGFRTITGVIGRTNKQNYLVKTDTATIGIRGTDHEPMVILPPTAGQAAIAAPGTYDKVNVGVAFIRTDAGSVDIQRNQVGFAPVSKAAPMILPRIPPFYKPTPAPGLQKGKEEAKDEGKKESQQSAAAPATSGDAQKPAETAAAAPAERTAEASAATRSTAVVDPTTTVSTAPAVAPVAAAPAAIAPVVEITATAASGASVNTTSQTVTTSSGVEIPVAEATTTSTGTIVPIAPTTPTVPVVPPVVPPVTPAPVISSPVVVTSNYNFGVMSVKPVTGGVERADYAAVGIGSANTNFVFSDLNLVDILKSPYQRFGLNYEAQPLIASADIKFSGGVAADAASDPNGTYYLGRWSGGQIAITDLATTSPVAPFTDTLGSTSAHWIIGLTPGNSAANPSINNVQQIVGTANYSLAAATHPTDAFGNVGTLSSATLAANFSAQTVDANLNLSFSSTDPLNLSKRNLGLAAAATNVPILGAGFQASAGGTFAPTVTCSGADCAASGYAGGIGGSFLASASGGATTGAVGTAAAIGYGFAPVVSSPAANQPFTDFIQGVAVLNTGAAPTVGTAAAPITGGTGSFRQQAYVPQTVGSSTYASLYSLASGVTTNAQNYVFDTSGNLVRIQSTDYKLSDRGGTTPPSYLNGALPYTGAPGGLPSSPVTGTAVSLSGGTTPDGNYNDTVNGIRMGRYTGGTITTTDFSNSASPLTYYTQLGNNNLSWTVREIPASIPTTGNFEYTPAYSTKPSDSLGNVGTLNYASLSANFTNQTVNPAVGITINNQTLSATATNVPIDSQFGFNVSSSSQQNPNGGGTLRVNCFGSNCAPAPVGINPTSAAYLSYIYTGYGGRIQGALAGASAAGGAFFRYDFNTYYNPLAAAGSAGGIPSGETRPVNDYVDGLVAFTQGASVAAPASARQLFRTAYLTAPAVASGFNQGRTSAYAVSPTGFTSPFGSGSPNTIGDPSGSGAWETLTGGTVSQAPTNANSFAATGISFGRYDGGTLTGVDGQGQSSTRTVANTYAWIKGPDVLSLTSAMTGSARYKFDGGTKDSATGVPFAGTVNYAVLAVNFNIAAVGVDLSVTGNGGANWTATTTGNGVLTGNPATTMRLSNGGFNGASFNATNPALHQSLFVTKNGSAGSAPNASGINGQINGNLMGSNLNGAGLSYSFDDSSQPAPGGGPQGAVAFALESYTSTPTPNNASGSATLTPTTTTGASAIDVNSVAYQVRLAASGLTANPAATPANAPASVDSSFLTQVRRSAENTGRLALGSDGLPTSWDGTRAITTTPTCTPTPCAAFVTQVPARDSIDPSSFVATGATPATNAAGQPLQVALPAGTSPATVLESGFDPATGMRWGRYGGGVIALFDRIGGGFAPTTYDVTNQNLHTILGPTQTGPITLPVTGTFTYTNVGGTRPTDNLGSSPGTLNAATLVADFAAQTVNTGVNLTVNGTTWAAGATAIPIQQAQFAASRDPSGGGNLNICAGATCGTTMLPTASTANTAGRIMGSFNGANGRGAGVAYSLNQGGVTGTTVSGVAAFKR